MRRADAFEIVRKHGGKPREGVTKQTDILIIGQLGWPLLDDGRPSNSLAQAKSYRIPVASEGQFLAWIGRRAPEEQSKTYSSTQLASLAKLPAEVVDQLAMFGLIEAQNGHYGFRDLSAARQVAALLGAGTGLSVITKSLYEIRKWLPDAGLSNLRLFPETSDRLLVEQIKGRTERTGQYILEIDAHDEDGNALFAKARTAEEQGDLSTAEQLYTRVMKLDRNDPVAPFNLGNVLRSMGRTIEVENAYRAAIKADPKYAPAWYNLADVLDESGRAKEAIEALMRALDADPAYGDAMFNMGLLLQRLERHAEAAVMWRRYLELDDSSPWASRARRALKYCEMQLIRP